MKVFLPAQAKVEDIVQIELHKSPSGLLAGLRARWLVGQEKKVTQKALTMQAVKVSLPCF